MTREERIAAHLRDHAKKVRRRRMARLAKDRRNKWRGLKAAIEQMNPGARQT